VGRDEHIEAILAAWYELQECAPADRAGWLARRNSLLDQAIAASPSRSLSRRELIEALAPRFNAYKLARRQEHQAKMADKLRQP